MQSCLLTSNKSSRVTWFFQKLWPVWSFSCRIIRLRSCEMLACLCVCVRPNVTVHDVLTLADAQ